MDTKKTLTVKEWNDEDKPREKMLQHGKKSLTNAELVAILLRSGVPGKSVVEVAKEILQMVDGKLTTLSRMDPQQLSAIKGLGTAKATSLMAALELGWRMQSEIDTNKEVIINDSSQLFNYMMSHLIDLDHEEFWVVYLSVRKKPIGYQRISVGGLTETSVDLRVLFRGAIENKAVSIAVLHNHPSGGLTPSTQDKHLTNRIYDAGKILGINLIEHLIVTINASGQADYYSFHDNGLV